MRFLRRRVHDDGDDFIIDFRAALLLQRVGDHRGRCRRALPTITVIAISGDARLTKANVRLDPQAAANFFLWLAR